MKPRLLLDSGREVYIDDFHLLHNIPNLLLGDPRSPTMWGHVVDEVTPLRLKHLLGPDAPVITLRPEPGPPPTYTAIVVLKSPRPVSPRVGDWSYLAVAWFLEYPEGSLLDMVHPAVCGIDWDRHARDASID
jgi:hypothetical protein